MTLVTKTAFTAMILIAALVGVAAAGRLSILGLATLPAGAVIAILGALAIMPVLATRLSVAVSVFLTWLVVEDLVRKLAGNDIRVYFIKDLFFLAILVAVFLDARSRGKWKEATGRSRIPLYAMICWAMVMSIPTGFADWRLPAIGMRLDFMYLPLTAVGFLLTRDLQSVRKWLGRLTILAAGSSVVGIAQSIFGPGFLSPGRATPGLTHLVLVRGLGGSGSVYRPTGTFVDPSRFASMAVVGVAVALAALVAQKSRLSPWVLAGGITSAAAVWISGGRTSFLLALVMLVVVIAAPSFFEKRMKLGPGVIAGGSLLLAIVALTALQPSLVSSRSAWYRATLDPTSSVNEWAFRFGGNANNTARGIALGGLMGQGTGQESLGQQYISGGQERSLSGIHQVEGGYAAVAVEWGIIGLLLWILWTAAWARRLWTSIQRVRGSPLAMLGVVLFTWTVWFLFIGFYGGLQGYQNYLANAYFWLFSGMVFGLPYAVENAATASLEVPRAT